MERYQPKSIIFSCCVGELLREWWEVYVSVDWMQQHVNGDCWMYEEFVVVKIIGQVAQNCSQFDYTSRIHLTTVCCGKQRYLPPVWCSSFCEAGRHFVVCAPTAKPKRWSMMLIWLRHRLCEKRGISIQALIANFYRRDPCVFIWMNEFFTQIVVLRLKVDSIIFCIPVKDKWRMESSAYLWRTNDVWN